MGVWPNISMVDRDLTRIRSQYKIDWSTGWVNSDQPAGSGPEWSVVICADWAPIRAIKQPLLEHPIDFYGDLLPAIREADVAIVNVECVLSDQPHIPILKDGPNLKAPTCAVAGLAAVPFHLACLANNHTLDYGPEALADMLEALNQANIQTVGAGLKTVDAERPVILDKFGSRLAVINAAEGEECRSVSGGPGVAGFDHERLIRQAADLKRKADLVIAILHAGREYLPLPPPYVYRTYRALIDAGADLVVGHHPHVPQGVEVYNGGLICYSLGNFAFWSKESSPYRRKGYLVKPCFVGDKLQRVQLLPYRLLSDRIVPLVDEERRCFLEDIREVSVVLIEPEKVERAWGAYADDWFSRNELSHFSCLASNSQNELSLLRIIAKRLWGRRRSLVNRCSRWLFRKVTGRRSSGKREAPDMQSNEEVLAMPEPGLHNLAKVRNRFDTLAHRELYLTALGRAMTGATDEWPGWARTLFEKWGAI